MALLQYYSDNSILECGLDETGVGCLSGDVYASAVIWPKEKIDLPDDLIWLNDSKKLSPKRRESLDDFIKYTAIDYAIGVVSVEEIDEMNILNARILAMHRAIDNLSCIPDLLLVDGNRFKDYIDPDGNKIQHKLIVKGDSKYQSIAAASIIAKNERDLYVQELDKEFPMYNWKSNKGYGSKDHYEAIKECGITKYHRKSFKLFKN